MELTEMTVYELSRLLDKGEVSSVELTRAYLDNISRGRLGTYITVTDKYALFRAEETDKRLHGGQRLHPLDGIPFSVKDNICTAGVRTTCASKMLSDFTPTYNATAVARLKEKGAVMLGKVNLDEFAMGIDTETSHFGRVSNPLDKRRSAGGSSGGSAASVVGGECAFSLGTDTGGSVRQPASFCGAVGMSPTYGRVSRFGLVSFAPSFDRIGVLSRDIADNALVLSAICGVDSHDATSVDKESESITASVCKASLTAIVPKEFLEAHLEESVKECYGKAIDVCRELGIEIKYVSIPELKYCLAAYSVLSSAEASSNLARYDGIRYGLGSMSENPRSIDEVRGEGFGDEVKVRVLFGTYVLGKGRRLYDKALEVRKNIMQSLDSLLDGTSFILAPSANRTAFIYGDKSADDLNSLSDFFTVSANLAGLPALSFPFGHDGDGLPIGMQIIGARFSEGLIYSAAAELTKAVETK